MPRRGSRWSLLVIFAACNLLFWIAVAAGVGVMASDMVDLGVESFLREKQATVVALSELGSELPSRTPGPTTEPAATRTLADEEQTSGAVVATEPAATSATSSASRSTPTAAAVAATAAKMTPYATRTQPAPAVTFAPTPQPTRATSSYPPPASQEPSAKLASAPLLLADPSLNELMGLDAEIRESATGRPVQIRYQETALNNELAVMLASDPDLPYQNVQADLERDSVTLTGDVSVMDISVSTVIKGRVLAQDCLPVVEISSVSVGGILTPAFVRNQVTEVVEDAFAWYPADYPLCLEQIVLEDGRATIYGSTR